MSAPPGLVFSFSCLWSCLPSCLGCCVCLLGSSPSPAFVSGLLSHPVFQLVWCVRALGLSPKFHVRFVQLFGVYGGVIFFLSLVLSPSLSPIWSGMLCPPRWPCLSLVCGLVSGLVCHLGWDAVSASLGCLRSCLPSGLGCCVRLAGLVFLLSAVLSALCPPRWAVSGLVSQLVSHLVWDALSASLVLSFSCLWSCLPAFVFVLSRSLSFIWDAVSAPPGLVFFLSLVLSPMLCLPSWLVSQPSLSPVFCPILFSSWSGVSVLWACLQNFMCDLCNCLGSTVVYFFFNCFQVFRMNQQFRVA